MAPVDPIEQLKAEHVTIVRMGEGIARRIKSFREEGHIDTRYVDTAVDFIRTYADLCHHGKEEGILFRALEGKDLDRGLAMLMKDLVREHQWARETTGKLAAANDAYSEGDVEVLSEELRLLSKIQRFYPGHITKEESRFFSACRAYFSDAEISRMGEDFAAFDQSVVHEKYRRLVERLEAGHPDTGI